MNGSIVIIARNNLALTKATLRTASEQDVPCDILVIDNASSDGTAAWLKTKPCASAIYLEQRSLSECWNRGIKLMWTIGHDRVLVLNNDLELRPDTYRLLASHGGPFVSCPSVDDRDRMGTPGDRAVEQLREKTRPHPGFSCFMISKFVTDRVGWFDESYFPAFCEDCDYHIRMHQSGIKAVCLDLPVYHLGSQTVKNATPGEKERILRGAEMNRQRFKMKYKCLPGTPEYYALFGQSV